MRKKISMAFILVCLGFIWGNSFLPAEVSGAMSGFVTKVFGGSLPENAALSESIVRKLAHGLEYAALGAGMAVYAYETIGKRLPLIGFSGLLAAVIDETIQLFSAGRSSQIGDVWIDFGGFAAGVALVLLIRRFIFRRRGEV